MEEAGKHVSSFRAEVRDANLSPDQRAVLQKAIDARFKVSFPASFKESVCGKLSAVFF